MKRRSFPSSRVHVRITRLARLLVFAPKKSFNIPVVKKYHLRAQTLRQAASWLRRGFGHSWWRALVARQALPRGHLRNGMTPRVQRGLTPPRRGHPIVMQNLIFWGPRQRTKMATKTKRDGGGADVIIVRPCRIQRAAMGFGRSWAGRLERCWICVCDAEVYILDETRVGDDRHASYRERRNSKHFRSCSCIGSLNPSFSHDILKMDNSSSQYQDRRRSFGRGGAGNIRI